MFFAWCDRKDWFGTANVLSDVSKRDQFATKTVASAKEHLKKLGCFNSENDEWFPT